MTFTWPRAALGAAAIFCALFLFKLFTIEPERPFEPHFEAGNVQSQGGIFESTRKNYASLKKLDSGPAQGAIGDSQKFEKIGSLSQTTQAFEEHRKAVDALVAAEKAIVQLERSTGLAGHRLLHLGIGVPPERFDAFVAAARTIGRSIAIEIVKNDKTNEYLQLKAKRATLEKARAALEELKSGGGSLDERVTVQNRLTDIEQQIQDLGVSLGDFDTENELCTVRLTLRESAKARPLSLARRILMALEWAAGTYIMIGLGFLGLMAAAWMVTVVLREAKRLTASGPAP